MANIKLFTSPNEILKTVRLEYGRGDGQLAFGIIEVSHQDLSNDDEAFRRASNENKLYLPFHSAIIYGIPTDDNRKIGSYILLSITYKYIKDSDAKRKQSFVRKMVEQVYYNYRVGDQMYHFNFPF